MLNGLATAEGNRRPSLALACKSDCIEKSAAECARAAECRVIAGAKIDSDSVKRDGTPLDCVDNDTECDMFWLLRPFGPAPRLSLCSAA